MHDYMLAHLSDAVLLTDLAALVASDRTASATLLAHIAEVDARRLYVSAGYPSMFAYCTDELRFSEDAAYKRIRAARAARRFPALFTAIAEGRLHLGAVCLLSPHLTAENAQELTEAATHRRKSDIEVWLAGRFPAFETMTPEPIIRPLPFGPRQAADDTDQLVLRPVEVSENENQQALGPVETGQQTPGPVTGPNQIQLAPGPAEIGQSAGQPPPAPAATSPNQIQLAPGPVEIGESADPLAAVPAAVSNPIQRAPGSVPPERERGTRFLVRVTIEQATHDKLRRAQVLLSHTVPARDVAQVLDRALDALLAQLEKCRLGLAGSKRRYRLRRRRSPNRDRYVPTEIRRAVWERDQGQCTFVGTSGHRCGARSFLEFDHVEPVSRGGKATVDGLRLRCRVHNQHEAECMFGTEFMKKKRRETRLGEPQAWGGTAEARSDPINDI